MPNLDLRRKTTYSAFRAMAVGTWAAPDNPTIYGSLEVPMEEMSAYIAAFRAQTGKRLTVTHVMAKAVGKVFEQMPDANAVLRFHRIYLRNEIAVGFQVALKDPVSGKLDLSSVKVSRPHARPLTEIVDDFQAATGRVRSGTDTEKEKTRQAFKRVPGWLVRPLLDLIGFLAYTLNLDLSRVGVPKDAFGSALVTNIGALGLKTVYAPLVPYTRVPILIAMGAVEKKPIVVDDTIRVGTVMGIHATLDHRLIDGAHAARMAKILHAIFTDPWTQLDPIERPDQA